MKYIILMTILSFLLVNNVAALTQADLPSGNKPPDWSRTDIVYVCAAFARNGSFDDVLWAIEHFKLEVPQQGYYVGAIMKMTLASVRTLRTGGDLITECVDELSTIPLNS